MLARGASKMPEKQGTTWSKSRGKKVQEDCSAPGGASSAVLSIITAPKSHCMVLAAFLVILEEAKDISTKATYPHDCYH